MLDKLKKELADVQAKIEKVVEQSGAEYDLSLVTVLEGDNAAKALAYKDLEAREDELKDQIAEREMLLAAHAAIEARNSGSDLPLPETAMELVGYVAGLDPKKAAAILGDMEAAANGGALQPQQAGTVGAAFTGHADFEARNGLILPLDIDPRAVMEAQATLLKTDKAPPEVTRSGRIVEAPLRPLQMLDIIPSITWNQSAYSWMEQTLATNGAKETAEGEAYAESAFAFEGKNEKMRKIGTIVPITEETLADSTDLATTIDSQLPMFVNQRLDSQLVVGDGNDPNLRGIMNIANKQTFARGAMSRLDSILRGKTLVRTKGRAMATHVTMNPLDAEKVLTQKDDNGNYIGGGPFNQSADRVWNLPIVENESLAEGTLIVGDFTRHSVLANKMGMEMEITNSHKDNFGKDIWAIKARIRAVFALFRPAAFVVITGWNA